MMNECRKKSFRFRALNSFHLAADIGLMTPASSQWRTISTRTILSLSSIFGFGTRSWGGMRVG
jgi:hypothetical protein